MKLFEEIKTKFSGIPEDFLIYETNQGTDDHIRFSNGTISEGMGVKIVGRIDGKTERLVSLCLQAGGTEYLSGPSAKNYIEEHLFLEQDIKISWFDYSNYPVYPQLYGKFIHEVSILDLLFNCGKDSAKFLKFSSSV